MNPMERFEEIAAALLSVAEEITPDGLDEWLASRGLDCRDAELGTLGLIIGAAGGRMARRGVEPIAIAVSTFVTLTAIAGMR